MFCGSVVVSQTPFQTSLGTPTPITQFISNYAYYQYFLQALTAALTFILKLLVPMHRCGCVAIIMVLRLAVLRIAGAPLLTEKRTLKLN